MNRVAALLLSGLTALFVGCDAGEPQRYAELTAPELGRAEPSVRAQLEEKTRELDAARSDSQVAPQEVGRGYGELGMLYHTYNLWSSAVPCYQEAARLDPGELRWPYLLSDVYRELGRQDESLAALRQALQLDAEYIPALLRLGLLELELNRHDDARRSFQEALALNPRSAPARIGLGKTALARGEFAEAVEHLEAALDDDSSASEIHYPLGLAYRGLGDADRAVEHLQARGDRPARVDDPQMAALASLRQGTVSFQTRADAYVERGQIEAAERELRQAVERSPSEPRLRVNLARLLVEQGKLDDARGTLEAALRLDEDYALAHYNLGTLLAKMGREVDAVEQYEAALRIQPGLLSAEVNLGNALRRLGRFEESLAPFARVARLDPRHAGARIAEALSMIRLGRHTAALQRLEQAHAELPREKEVLHALVRLLAASPDDSVRDGARALQLAEALAVDGAPAEHAAAVAMAAAEAGEFDTAVRIQQQLVAAADRGAPPHVRRETRANLELYRSGRPCRRPWSDEDPMLSPDRRPEP